MMKASSVTGPLKGVKVLDLSRVLAGPWASQALADFGADVWKIEHPEGGDDTRQWGENMALASKCNGNMSAYYLSANRGKSSLTIDISTDKGQQIIRELVQKADILIENFKVGNLKKYGLDHASLSKLNPGLIYCSITGFGQTGSYAVNAGYDAMIQASAGLMSLTGEKNGEPQKVGVAASDLMTGMYAVSAILAALYHRSETGEGQYIDLALFDTQVSWLANQSMSYLLTGKIPERQGAAHPQIVPYQPVECQDGLMMLAIGNDQQFKLCCEQIGLSRLSEDDRFKTNNARVNNHERLIELMTEKFKTKQIKHWLGLLSKSAIPCGPINNLKQVFEHPQIKARDTLFSLNHPQLGEMPQVANPVKFSKTPISYTKAAPTLGEDTENILRKELNFSKVEIKELEMLGII